MRSRYNTTSYDCVPMKLRAKRSYYASTTLLPRLSRLRCVLSTTLSRLTDVHFIRGSFLGGLPRFLSWFRSENTYLIYNQAVVNLSLLQGQHFILQIQMAMALLRRRMHRRRRIRRAVWGNYIIYICVTTSNGLRNLVVRAYHNPIDRSESGNVRTRYVAWT